MAKILSLETYWTYGKNFESANLLNIWQKFWDFFPKVWDFLPKNFEIFFRRFWVWKLIESMAKILRFFTNKFWNFVQKVLRFFQKIFNPETYWIFCKNSKSGNLLNIWQTFWDFFKRYLDFLPRNFEIFYQKIEIFFRKLWDFFQKILSLETYWIYGKNFESGNLLNIWQKLGVLKLIEHMAKIRSLETYWIYGKNFESFYQKILRGFFKKFKDLFENIFSPETYWIFGKNSKSGNLLNIW